jgi:hypothetical protein
MDRVENKQSGYEYNIGRFGGFFLGHIYELKREYALSKKYFHLSISYAELAGATERGYYYYSWLHLGTIAERENELDLAKSYYKKVRKLTSRKHAANKSAKERLKKLKSKD